MRINNIVVRNLGPIKKLDLCLEGENVVFTGINGSGKTFLISSIVDFIYENLHMLGFDDVLPNKGSGYSYFRVTKPGYVKLGEQCGFVWIDGDINGEPLEYLECYGYEAPEEISAEVGIPIENLPWPRIGRAKTVKSLDETRKQNLKSYARNDAVIYIPATRYEEDFWKNEVFFDNDFSIKDATNTTLGRPIEIRTSMKENYAWFVNDILDMFLYKTASSTNRYTTINRLLGIIMNEARPVSVRIAQNYNDRIVVQAENDIILRSLSDLSLGQASILYLAMNILRYGDAQTSPSEITGLVIVDELDTHLHEDLKHEALPQLIKLFPKVQFILTTHDPSCLVSVEETEAVKNIISLPDGGKIYASEYAELSKARNHLFTASKKARELCALLSATTKPIALVEDRYTQLYKIAWLKVNNIEFTEDNLEEVFSNNCNFDFMSSDGHTNTCALFSKEYLVGKIKDKKVIGLFDFDEAFNSFNRLPKEIWGEVEGEDNTGLYRRCKISSGLHAIMLPVPDFRTNIASSRYGNKSRLELELLFKDDVLADNCSPDHNAPGNFSKFRGDKRTFWKQTILFDKEVFGSFRPLFDKINELLT